MLLSRARLTPSRLPRLTAPLRSSSSSSSAAAPPIPPVVATAPELTRHLLIHTPHPSATWPSHLSAVSPLYQALAELKDPALKGFGFNYTDAGNGDVAEGQEWDPRAGKFDAPKEGQLEESYSATLYPDFLTFPSLSISTLPALITQLSSLPPPPSISPSPASPSSDAAPPRTHIFICTHTSRDCRCGDLGEPLYEALVDEIKRRRIKGGELKDGEDGVRVSRVAHVGGHKWAGNALVYREGVACDWYGLLRAPDAPLLLSYALSSSPAPLWSHWRGRLGLSPSAVKDAYASRKGEVRIGRKEEKRRELGESVELVFRTFEGEERRCRGYEGETLMEVARRHDLPSILATCGGHCECATCHVHLPPFLPSPSTSSSSSSLSPSSTSRQPTAIPQPAPVPELTDEEDEQLEFALGADDDSRLACQIPVTRELGEWCAQGGRVRLPRY